MSYLMLHVGGRLDLPVPLSFFVIGAGLAVAISFTILNANWVTPRLQNAKAARPVLPRLAALAARTLPWVGMVGYLIVVTTPFVSGTSANRPLSPVLVWVAFWLIVPFGSALLGGWWRSISPFRTIVHFTARGVCEKPQAGKMLECWPAVVAFMSFVWFELVAVSNTATGTLATATVTYTVYLIILARWVGPETALRRGDAFEVYNSVISRLAMLELHRGPPASIRRRGVLRDLPALRPDTSEVVFIIAMVGTVTYDGMTGATWWADLVGEFRHQQWFETVALLLVCTSIGLLYWGGCHLASRLAASQLATSDITKSLAHTLVPIAFAYAAAHYFSLVVYEGQLLIHTASDPFSRGWDLFGTAGERIKFTSSQLWIWYVQVVLIVLGHIAGVVLAHDRALADFGQEKAVRTQYALLLLMVALTSLGLFILAG